VVKGLGDHEALTNSRGPQITTPMFIDAARRCARLAMIIENKEAADRCLNWAAESTTAWENAFLDPETGKVETGSQTEQLLALGFGAVPENMRTKAFERMVEAVKGAENGPALTTGIFGTRFLLEELSKGGRSDLAHALAVRKSFPSWGWMLENDATTLWEDWEGTDNVKSHNHPMFGSISGWFHRWLGGIQAADDAIGFDRILIRPQVVKGLDWVKCSHRSIRGPIASNWKVTSTGTDYEIIIPPDTTAIIELPKPKTGALTEGGKLLDGNPDITALPSSSALHRLQVGSGHYLFSSQ
jgi:alpha-L-rhamnosidase